MIFLAPRATRWGCLFIFDINPAKRDNTANHAKPDNPYNAEKVMINLAPLCATRVGTLFYS